MASNNRCQKCNGKYTKSGQHFCVVCHKWVCGYCVMGSRRGAVCSPECREKAATDATPTPNSNV